MITLVKGSPQEMANQLFDNVVDEIVRDLLSHKDNCHCAKDFSFELLRLALCRVGATASSAELVEALKHYLGILEAAGKDGSLPS